MLVGAEFRFFPPPSMLVFSAMAGVWRSAGDAGMFGGAGLGIIF
jgi:hypothetical protein